MRCSRVPGVPFCRWPSGDADTLRRGRGLVSGGAFPRRMSARVFRLEGTNILCVIQRCVSLVGWVCRYYAPAAVAEARLRALLTLRATLFDVEGGGEDGLCRQGGRRIHRCVQAQRFC